MNQGTRWVILMQKNRHQKSHAWAPLRAVTLKSSGVTLLRLLLKVLATYNPLPIFYGNSSVTVARY
jgi:hypothetical protein